MPRKAAIISPCQAPAPRPPHRLWLRPGLLALALLATPAALQAQQIRDPDVPLAVVAGFDQNRLVGDWFEIARADSRLQIDCHGVTTRIEARDDSRLMLKLACHKGAPDGPVLPIDGVLVQLEPGLFQWRLVRFSGLGEQYLAVLWAAPDDSVMVIGSPQGQVGWVLAKTPDADPAAGIGILQDNGYAPRAITPASAGNP
jgi:apolipoprotein D and lipocalin family protein